MIEFKKIPVDKIERNPEQSRKNFDVEEIEKLGESIENRGLLQPITVVEVEDGYRTVSGERRWRACEQIGKRKIPAIIQEDKDKQDLAVDNLVENLQRKDINPVEEARGIKSILEAYSKEDQSPEDLLWHIDDFPDQHEDVKQFFESIGITLETAWDTLKRLCSRRFFQRFLFKNSQFCSKRKFVFSKKLRFRAQGVSIGTR